MFGLDLSKSKTFIELCSEGQASTVHEKPIEDLDDDDLLIEMIRNEVSVAECLTFFKTSISYCCIDIKGANDKYLPTKGEIIEFLMDSIVYYFAYGFVPFCFVPSNTSSDILRPIVLPLHKTTWKMDNTNQYNFSTTPDALLYAKQCNSGDEQTHTPRVFSYSFYSNGVDESPRGILFNVLGEYRRLLKARLYMDIVYMRNTQETLFSEKRVDPKKDGIDKSTVVTHIAMERIQQLQRSAYGISNEKHNKLRGDGLQKIDVDSTTRIALLDEGMELKSVTRNVPFMDIMSFEDTFKKTLFSYLGIQTLDLDRGYKKNHYVRYTTHDMNNAESMRLMLQRFERLLCVIFSCISGVNNAISAVQSIKKKNLDETPSIPYTRKSVDANTLSVSQDLNVRLSCITSDLFQNITQMYNDRMISYKEYSIVFKQYTGFTLEPRAEHATTENYAKRQKTDTQNDKYERGDSN